MAGDSVVEKLIEAIEDGRLLVREMHEANKDLKASIKEAKATKEDLLKYVREEVQIAMSNEVQQTFDKMTSFQHEIYNTVINATETVARPLIDMLFQVEDRAREMGYPLQKRNRQDFKLPPVEILEERARAKQNTDV